MPLRINPLSDQEYRDALPLLEELPESQMTPFDGISGAELRRGVVKGHPDALAIWIRVDDEIVGYVLTESLALPGVRGRHVIRGWTASGHRRRGVFARLLSEAASGETLIADRNGMTDDAFQSMKVLRGFSKCYLDQTNWNRMSIVDVPDATAFGLGGARWLLLLEPDPILQSASRA